MTVSRVIFTVVIFVLSPIGLEPIPQSFSLQLHLYISLFRFTTKHELIQPIPCLVNLGISDGVGTGLGGALTNTVVYQHMSLELEDSLAAIIRVRLI